MAEHTAPELIDRMMRALNEASAQLEQYKRKATEPIAVVGMACRFPGAATPQAFWKLLQQGEDCVRDLPPARVSMDDYYDPVPATPGKSYVRAAALLDDVAGFDAAFFGLSPRESLFLDPQQRLLLEVSWEALEHAGLAPSTLKNSRTGIYVGVSPSQYHMVLDATQSTSTYATTGNAPPFASGRLSYVLGLQGPNLVIDTACSASLIGVHLACESLRSGSTDLALAGGVHLILSAIELVALSQLQALAPDGRCKTFDASADGFGDGEGCGMVVLKRLSDARAQGDPILAVIRGSATNHDGASSGLTVPSGAAQAALLRQALANGAVHAHTVGYVEAHGTGTKLGDPIEMNAIASVYCATPERQAPLWVGSAKTNIGHLQEAAGVAGLIKVILCMQHGEIAPHLHFHQPNPYIEWDRMAVAVPTARTPWPAGKKVAAVSAFGMGGSNAHVVLEEAPAPKALAPGQFERPCHLLALSARNAAALAALVQRYASHLQEQPGIGIGDLCYSAATGRNHFTHRLAFVTDSPEQLQEQLAAYSRRNRQQAGTPLGEQAEAQPHPKLAFLFTGQGAQVTGMGQELYATQPLFRQTLDRCAELLAGQMAAPLLQVLGYVPSAENDAAAIDRTENAQPALFALEYALATLWLSWGGKPDLLLGHSVGELAAACVAGIFSLEDGLKLAAARGRLMGALPPEGTMVALQASEARVQTAVAAWQTTHPQAAALSIAAVNGPASVVLSGSSAAVMSVAASLAAEGIKQQLLKVSHAFHSPLMAPMLQAFQEVAASIRYSPARMRIVSAVTGKIAGKELATPDYWVRHVVEPVRFADSVATLHKLGAQTFLEIGPKPVLLGMVGECLEALAGPAANTQPSSVFLPSLRSGQSEWQQMLASLGELYVQGVPIDWQGFDRGYPRQKVSLPTYPFQREVYWASSPPAASPPAGMAQANSATLAGWLDTQNLHHLAATLAEQAGLAGAAEHTESVESRLLAALQELRRQQQLQAQLEPLFYSVDWIRQALPAPAAPSAAGRWLLLADRQGVGDALAALLAAHGEQVHCVYAGIDPAHIDEVLAQLAMPDTHPWRGTIHLWSLDASDPPADAESLQALQQRNLGCVLRIVQQLAAEQDTNSTAGRLWLVTQGAQQIAETEPVSFAQSPLWGMGKVVALEHPELFGGLVDLEPGAVPSASAQVLLQEIGQTWQHSAPGEQRETQLAWRQGERYAARLIRSSAESLRPVARPAIAPGATYLVTGGLGALGLQVAEWLAGQGATHLLLTGRRGVTTKAQRAVVERLAAGGVEVQIAQLDVADPVAMQQLFVELKAAGDAGRPLKGVMHVAGVLDDGILLNQSWARFEGVLSAKVQGSWLLHTLTQGMALDFMLFFSSVASLLGNPGQAAYAAGNAFLDGLARSRHQQGLPGLSLNWGAWDGEEERDGGMATRVAAGTGRRMLDAAQFMSPQLALLALEQLLGRSGQYAIARIDWSRLNSSPATPFLANFILSESRSELPLSWQQQLAALPPSRRLDHLQRSLQQMVGSILGMAEPPSIASGFTDLGMDSLMALELRRALERTCACKLPTTLVFEYPSIAALAEYLLAEILALSTAESSRPVPQQTRNPAEPGAAINPAEPIAVISMACRFPGADSPEAFWAILCSMHDRVRDIPPERWDVDAFYDPQRPKAGKMYTRAGAFLDQVDHFDPLFFGISPREAATIDPQHRLLLEVSWEVLERSGVAQHTLVDSHTGVFVGIGESDYALAAGLHDLSRLEPHQATGVGHSIAAGRLAYTLGVQGPVLAVDTACSSALVALHLACQSLRSRECDLALAGAVSLMLAPTAYVALSQMQALSPDGRCKTFDETADGYGRGEGSAMVLLKRLTDAEADGDTVLAVIRGSAVNHDGPSSGLTVPNKRAQEKLLAAALSHAHVAAADIGYIEAHGTGTPLGDPIELRAIDAVFGQPRPHPLYVGSVKTHIGHLEAAAGIAGFVKTVLALQHGQIPPHLHLTRPTPHLDWEQMAVRVPTTLRAWPSERRVAGVSAFGLSGTNAHIILEAAPSAAPPSISGDKSRPSFLLPLSARDPAALPALAARYLAALQTGPDLGALCYTAAVGRNHFDQRVALVAPDQKTLEGQLAALARAEQTSGVVQGRAGHYAPRLAMLFSGQGAQMAGMGQELYASEPLFRSAIDRCAQLLEGQSERPLLEMLQDAEAIDQTACTQPALFALEYALATLWMAWGIQPDLLLGHSVGELAAACVAGVFSLEDGLKLVAARGRLMGELPQAGMMVALPVSEARARTAIDALYTVGQSCIPLFNGDAARTELAIAAVNGPQSVVISGRQAAVQAVVQKLAAEGVKAQPLKVSHAFHSPLMDDMLDAFAAVARAVAYHPPTLPLVSNLTGRLAGDEIATAEYWVRHAREAVRFADGVATLHAQGIEIFLEIGPRPVLLGMAGHCLEALSGRTGTFSLLPSLRPGEPESSQMLSSLGQLYARGSAIDWETFTPPANRQRILLPTYPFQRQRYWHESAAPTSSAAAEAAPPTDKADQGVKLPSDEQTTPQQQQELLHSLQQTLARILRLENIQRLDAQQSLLELGLDSLLAFEARNQLSALLGCELPATLLYDYPTLEKLAAYLTPIAGFAATPPAAGVQQKPARPATRLARSHSAVVALQPHGTKPPLFCLPPIAGTVQPYAQLAAQLGPDQPVYGLQAVGVENDCTPLTDLREIAAYFIAALQSVQPKGPYYLCGWSFGIFPAFEMAQQLHQHGEQVALLAALDQEMLAGNKLERLWSGTRFLFTTGIPNLWPYLSDVFQSAGKTQTAPLAPQLNALRTAVGMRLLRVMTANSQALADYQPYGYPGSLVLFQTRALRQRLLQDPTAGWGKYVRGGVRRHDIPGHHMNLLLAPQVASVAKKMQQVLHELHASHP